MRIALLQCDHVDELYWSVTSGDYDELFRRHFARYAPEVKLVPFDVTLQQYPESVDGFDAFITTGAKASVYDDEPWVQVFKAFVKELFHQQQTFIGICFGHQMMAESLGGKVAQSPNGWGVGVRTFEVHRQEKWMQPPMDRFNVLMSCQDQIEVLPENSIVLGGSDFCPVGMYRVGERFLGIQGHPEFTVEYARALMDDRIEKIGKPAVRLAAESLDLPIHAGELTRWIVEFIHLSR